MPDRDAQTSKKRKTKRPSNLLPPWKVILHNDNVNQAVIVARTVAHLTPLSQLDAAEKTMEAHKNGSAVLLVTHRERAELYQDQFQSCIPPIKVTIEPDA